MSKDKVTITLTLERQVNGTVNRRVDIEGGGFHFYELVGLLQMCSYDFAQKSYETAKDLPQDVPVRIEFNKDK